MRYVLILGLALMTACSSAPTSFDCSKEVEAASMRIDSLRSDLLAQRDSLTLVLKAKSDSVRFLKSKNDTLKGQYFIANYRVEKVRFYLGLCKKDRSQDKFLKGWVTRAVE